MDYPTPDLMRKMDPRANVNARAAFHPPMREPVTAPVRSATCAVPRDRFEHESVDLGVSRILRIGLSDVADALGIDRVFHARDKYHLVCKGRAQPFTISRADPFDIIRDARRLHDEVYAGASNATTTPATPASQEAA